jgi:trehalose-6-phosphate synthase
MTSQPRALMVSDRGPLAFEDLPGGLRSQARAGSVTELIATACRASDGVFAWWATSSSAADARALTEGMFSQASNPLGFAFEPLIFEECQYREYYDEASVRLLWFAHHDLWDEVRGGATLAEVDAFNGSFRIINEQFALKISRTIPKDVPVLFSRLSVLAMSAPASPPG